MEAATFGCLHIVVADVPLTVFTSLRPAANQLSSVFLQLSCLSLFQPIRTYCQFSADTILFFTWASLILHIRELSFAIYKLSGCHVSSCSVGTFDGGCYL